MPIVSGRRDSPETRGFPKSSQDLPKIIRRPDKDTKDSTRPPNRLPKDFPIFPNIPVRTCQRSPKSSKGPLRKFPGEAPVAPKMTTKRDRRAKDSPNSPKLFLSAIEATSCPRRPQEPHHSWLFAARLYFRHQAEPSHSWLFVVRGCSLLLFVGLACPVLLYVALCFFTLVAQAGTKPNQHTLFYRRRALFAQRWTRLRFKRFYS